MLSMDILPIFRISTSKYFLLVTRGPVHGCARPTDAPGGESSYTRTGKTGDGDGSLRPTCTR